MAEYIHGEEAGLCLTLNNWWFRLLQRDPLSKTRLDENLA